LKKDRPAVTAAVSWAAKNGDRSENADYQYGKKRLREIDRRLRFLTKRLDIAEVVDPAAPRDEELAEQIFFGATVTYARADGQENTITIVGIDEVDMARNHVSWISPLARALMKSRVGDAVVLLAPGGVEELEVIDVQYVRVDVENFVPTEAVFAVDKKT
ncbi:MAG: transcription elongation factor GreB, partial [Usitatibacteraceae bacterium]